MDQTKKFIPALVALVLLSASFFAGIAFGVTRQGHASRVVGVLNQTEGQPDIVDFSPFWRTWNLLDEHFVSPKGELPVFDERVWGAIQGLARSFGDPYTEFFPPKESEIFAEDVSGNFGGVGMEIGLKDGVITVIAPLKRSPAEQAGVRAGDRIVDIDGASTADMSVTEAVQLIRGEVGTDVAFTFLRAGSDEAVTVTVTRSLIQIPTIDTESRHGVFIIHLYNFSAISPNLFRDALREFVETGGDKLILDLRGNPGGYLEAAVDVSSWFLPMGEVVVRESTGDPTEEVQHRSRGFDIFTDDLRMAILVDGGSASASEIVAGALSEHGIATLVGSKTFGKGSVQELFDVADGSSLKVTTAQWLTPNGNSISDGGLTPEIIAEITEEDIEAGHDPQLLKATEYLRGG